MRACACDTASRLWARTVLCKLALLLIPPLPSIDSAVGCPPLFVDFIGTISRSDFFAPCIIGFGLALPDAFHRTTRWKVRRSHGSPLEDVRACAGSQTTWDQCRRSRLR